MQTDGLDLFFTRQIEANKNVAYLSDDLKNLIEEEKDQETNDIYLTLQFNNEARIQESLIQFSKQENKQILIFNTNAQNIKMLFDNHITSASIFLKDNLLKSFSINNNIDFSFKRNTVDNYILEIIIIKES